LNEYDEIDDAIAKMVDGAKQKASTDQLQLESTETTFYNCFASRDGRLVLKILREQLQITQGSFSLHGRDNPTINVQRDAQRLVYWMIFNLAEAGANRVGDTFWRKD
jgi:hypothetical protein